MSIWSDLLSLHGYVTHTHNDDVETDRRQGGHCADEADRLREIIGSRSPTKPRPEPRGPLLGVHGLT